MAQLLLVNHLQTNQEKARKLIKIAGSL